MIKNFPLVSIIVPAFNVSKYINDCLDSLVEQTYKNIEIIVIDDGSSDDTFDIVHTYSKVDSRIKAYKYNNGGLSKARNRGLSKVKGSYVMFLDSDDLLSRDSVEYCINNILEHNLDAFYFDRESFFDNESIEHGFLLDKHRKSEYCDINFNGVGFYEKTIGDKSFLSSACYAMFDMSILWSDCFIEGILHEDEIFTAQVLTSGKIKRLRCSTKQLYKRRVRPNSIMTTKATIKNVLGYLKVATELMKIYRVEDVSAIRSHTRSMFYMACVKASQCKIQDKLLAISRLVGFTISTPEFRFSLENYIFSLLPSVVEVIKKFKQKFKR